MRAFNGQNLQDLRREAKQNREAVALAAHRTVNSIANYETGRAVPSADVLAALADALGVDVDAFFSEMADA